MTTKELIKKAEELFDTQDYNAIINLLSDELLLKQKNALLYAWRGYAYNEVGENDKAIEDYDKAIGLRKNFYEAHLNRCAALQKKGDYSKAIEDANVAVRLRPNSGDAYCNRGSVLDDIGEYDNAIRDFNKALRLNKNDYEIYNNRGITWRNKGNLDKAIDDYNRAIYLNKNFILAYRNRGQAFEKKGDYKEAFNNYEKALSIEPDDVWARVYRNQVAARLGIPLNLKDLKADVEISKIAESISALPGKEQIEIIKHYKLHIENIVKKIRELASYTDNVWQETDTEKWVAHYSNLKVADLIIMKDEQEVENKKTGKKEKHSSRLRYTNAVFMNDPDEGKVLIDSIDHLEQDGKAKANADAMGSIKTAFYNVLKEERTNFYIGSFLPVTKGHEDELLMWRTYGKDEEANEAAGCCMVIDTAFFDKLDGGSIATGKEENKKSLHPLYKVLYYDRRDNKFLLDENSALEKEIKNLKKALLDLLEKKKKGKSEKIIAHNKAIEKVLYHSLSELRYFFKSADYAYENELRVIQFATSSETVKITDKEGGLPRKMYIESTNEIKKHLKKIVLGPMVKHPERWMYLGKQMEDEKRPIVMVMSNCHFQ